MLRIALSRLAGLLSGLMLFAAAGCNDAGSATGTTEAEDNRLPLLSVGEVPARPVTDFQASEPTEAEPTPAAAPNDAGPTPATAPEAEITLAEAELAQALQLWTACEEAGIAAEARREKLNQIIERTSHAIDLTRGQTAEADVLNLAAVTRANARVQLALLDDAITTDTNTDAVTQADLLAREADELFEYDATSMAATETAYRVVELARQLAERHHGDADPKWATSYARQARLFAQRFPLESHRGPMSLVIAAVTCERAGLVDEARQCYTVVQNSFGDSLASSEAERSLRRLNLVGQPLVGFAGETLDDGQLDVADLKGQMVLIVFWQSDSREFFDQYEQLLILKETHGETLEIVGVNLDTDEALVRDFVEARNFPGETIFFSDPILRGNGNPLAMHYAVHEVPTYWLIDSAGIVTATSLDIDELSANLIQLAQ